MSNDLKLRVVFDMVDRITKPLRTVLAGTNDLGKAMKASRDQIKALERSQKDVGDFRTLRTAMKGTAGDLAAVQERIKSLAGSQAHLKGLADSLHQVGPPTRAMVRDFDQAKAKVREFEKAKASASQLKATFQQQADQVRELRDKLAGAGIETRNLAQHERTLRNNITATNGALSQQQAKLAEVAARERKLSEARGKMNALQGTAANMAVAGYAAKSAGTHVLTDLGATVGESKKYETDLTRIRALGMGDEAAKDADKYSRAMKVYGTSTTDNISVMRDAMAIFADEHHAKMVAPTLAKMKFANEALFGGGDGHANEEKFMNMLKVIELRGGTKNEATFKDEANMVQKVLTSTGGRVGPDEWKNFIQTGGVAAKQLRKDAFFYQMEPLIQEMGGHSVGTGLMSAYSNVYQGKTTVRAAKQMMDLKLLDPKMVEYNKIGMIKQIKPGALAGGDMLKASPLEWLEKVLLPKLEAKGITDPDKVKDMISTIFTNRTASNLFTTMYMQRDQIHKNAKLSAGADDIDALDKKGQGITSGREVAALAKVRDLKLELGEKIMPLYNRMLTAGSAALDTLTGFMQNHSTAATVIVTTLGLLAGVMAILGTLTIVAAGVLGPLAALKFSMVTLGIQGTILSNALGLVTGAARMVGTAVMFMGRAMLMNPIGLAITAIAVGAFLIYKYWEPIKAFFADIWTRVCQVFDGGLAGIGATLMNWSPMGLLYRAFAGIMSWFGVTMPAQFSTFGANILQGLVGGILGGLGAVKDAISGVAEKTVSWFKEKLGIHSPSLVFGELGGFISEGAAIGIDGKKAAVAKASALLAATAITAFGNPAAAMAVNAAGPALAPISTQLPAKANATAAFLASLARPVAPNALYDPSSERARPLAFDTRPPIGPQAQMPSQVTHNSYEIKIFPAPGADPDAIARAVGAELDRRERANSARHTSRFTD